MTFNYEQRQCPRGLTHQRFERWCPRDFELVTVKWQSPGSSDGVYSQKSTPARRFAIHLLHTCEYPKYAFKVVVIPTAGSLRLLLLRLLPQFITGSGKRLLKALSYHLSFATHLHGVMGGVYKALECGLPWHSLSTILLK